MLNGRKFILVCVLSLSYAYVVPDGDQDNEKVEKKQNVCTFHDMLKMKLSISEIQSKTSNLETDVCRLKNEVMQFQGPNKTVEPPRTIAFYNVLTAPLTPNERVIDLVFDTLITNEGGAFNLETGRFTAPSDGTYEFTLIISATTEHQAAAEIVVNGDAKCTAWSDCRQSWVTATNRVVVHLSKGDLVWLRSRNLDNHFYGNHYYNSFSGMRLN